MQKYSELLTGSRFRKSEAGYEDLVKNAESDRGRLVYCPAFRRLQQKAQVFSMEPNAAVRSRLTHSLEVAHMGRYIADQIVEKLKKSELASDSQCTAIVTFVETACLMHDIGNPPFGHFGEAAISEWFRANGEELVIKSCRNNICGVVDDHRKEIAQRVVDFIEFDGNPQGLRIVTKLQRNADENGLNLTKTTLASYLKYIRTSGEKKDTDGNPFIKKCGFFQTEANLVKEIWAEFKYSKPQRFPLAYIMEAADDLAYCISDLEDSIEKGLIRKKDAIDKISTLWDAVNDESPIYFEIKKCLMYASFGRKNLYALYTFIDFRTSINRLISGFCADQYLFNHEAILKGEHSSLLSEATIPGKFLALLKNYCRENVYSHSSVQRTELVGYKAIYGLLDVYKSLLGCDLNRFECALNGDNSDGKFPIVVEKKYLSLFPESYKKTYCFELESLKNKTAERNMEFYLDEWNIRAHLIVDYLSGMTDDFAVKTYRELSGMKL